MNTQPIIQVQNLTAGYGQTAVLEKVSFEIHPGEVFVILGGSGCGKSTILRHIIGLLPPLEGKIFIHGKDLTTATGKEQAEILKSMGVSFQSGALFGSMTLLENVRLPLEEHTELSDSMIDQIASVKLAQVGLSGY